MAPEKRRRGGLTGVGGGVEEARVEIPAQTTKDEEQTSIWDDKKRKKSCS